MTSFLLLGAVALLSVTASSTFATDIKTCNIGAPQSLETVTGVAPPPERTWPRIQTSGRVTHVQVGLESVAEINEQFYNLITGENIQQDC